MLKQRERTVLFTCWTLADFKASLFNMTAVAPYLLDMPLGLLPKT